MAAVCTAAMAQPQEEKKGKNIFVGAGLGAMTVFNDGMNSPTLNIEIQVGKYLTPTWGIRGELSGLWQSLEEQSTGYSKYCKKFGELNLDAMLNLNSLFGNKNVARVVDVYIFGGPTLNISSAVSKSVSYSSTVTSASDVNVTVSGDGGSSYVSGQTITATVDENDTYSTSGTRLRVGATVGLGLGFNLNTSWAITLEGRLGVTPSIFGYGSDCRTAEATGRLNVGFIYTIGGKNFTPKCAKIDMDAINEELNRYRAELARTQEELDKCRNAGPRIETREVVKENPVTSFAVFFKLGSSKIDEFGKAQIQLAAKIIKQGGDKKYKVSAYADKGTGSADINQKLSDARAQAVYDALVAEGVSASQLEIVSNGGVDDIFGTPQTTRVVVTE